jgi:HEAT repeat protein
MKRSNKKSIGPKKYREIIKESREDKFKGNQNDISCLIKALGDKDKKVRINAIKALGEIGKPAIDILIKVLEDKNKKVRGPVPLALGEIAGKLSENKKHEIIPAINPLIKVLEDKDEKVRANAAWSFWLIALELPKDKRHEIIPMIDSLIKTLIKDKDQRVCGNAAFSLKTFAGLPFLEKEIIEQLKKLSATDLNNVMQYLDNEAKLSKIIGELIKKRGEKI